jgi:membrane-bound lytic murein transglycosylase D
MDDRTKTLYSFFVIAAVLTLAGCGVNQQAKFQMSFLPPAPHPMDAAAAADTVPPPVPVAQPNLYIHDVPAFLLANPQLPERKTRGDAQLLRADQTFQRGRRAYQANDITRARREFDTAIDLMLEASELNPADRMEYDRRLDEMVDAIHKLDLAGMGASAAVEEGKFEKAPLEDLLQMTFPVDPKLKDRVREQVAATVSQLPLSVNDTVLGYINYFSKRGHGTIVAGTQRSGKYRPMIQRILDEEGVPQELIHLAQAESGFIPRAISRAAAIGMWQFLVWRGNEYGLKQTRHTDDRMDPEKATRAAARHLHDLYNQFGDWYLAIAAYNCGPGVVEKAVERTGYADFWELRARGVLPAETTNYVPIILAMTIMEKNAAEYGLEGLQLDPALEYDTVETSAPTSIGLLADILDAAPAQLAALNPAVLRGIAPENFPVHVPKGSGNQVMAALQMVPAEHRDSWRMHRVSAGETLAEIGKRFGAAPTAIIAANRLQAGEVADGDMLMIPAVLRSEPPSTRRAVKSTPSRRATSAHHAVTVKAKSGSKPAVATVHGKKPPVMVARTSVK